MELQLNAINWVEIPVTDFDRAKAFYNTIYNFEMPEMPMGDDRLGILLYDMQKGGVGAAIVQGPGYTPHTDGIKVYLNANPDLQTILDRVEGAGGQVVIPKTVIPGDMGYMAFFQDTEGNHIGLHSMS